MLVRFSVNANATSVTSFGSSFFVTNQEKLINKTAQDPSPRACYACFDTQHRQSFLIMSRKSHFGVWMMLLGFASLNANAADKIILTINHQTISIFRTVDLENAKKEAIAAHKPIAWIASAPQLLDGRGTIALENSRGATLHALYALRDKAVLIFEDAYAENHKVPPLVDNALHTPDPHYTPPTVLFLDPEVRQVLAKVIYEPDFVKRAHALADALGQVK
jgi:hypothetical protein